MKIARKEGWTMSTRVIGTSISSLAGDGLERAFSLAIGLAAARFGEEVFEA